MNLAIDGSTCRTPSEHRAVVATCGARRGDVLAWPTAERLRHDLYRLGLLVRWRELMEPPSVGGEPDPADDGRALVINRTDRPTVDEVVAAWLRPTYVSRRLSRGSWEYPVRRPDGGHALAGRVHMGELLYHASEHTNGGPVRGELVEWGRDKHGRPLTPYEKLTLSSRGGRRRNVPGTRQRKAIDPSGDWYLYIGHVTSLDDQRGDDAFDAVTRAQEARIARKHIGPLHAEALDLAISSATAKTIGETIEKRSGKYAEVRGIRLVDDALDAFGAYVAEMQLAADNDNEPQENMVQAA